MFTGKKMSRKKFKDLGEKKKALNILNALILLIHSNDIIVHNFAKNNKFMSF